MVPWEPVRSGELSVKVVGLGPLMRARRVVRSMSKMAVPPLLKVAVSAGPGTVGGDHWEVSETVPVLPSHSVAKVAVARRARRRARAVERGCLWRGMGILSEGVVFGRRRC